jgi:hypothetical protein
MEGGTVGGKRPERKSSLSGDCFKIYQQFSNHKP